MSKFDALEMAGVDEPSRMTIEREGKPLRDAEGKDAYIDLLSLDSQAARKFERRVTNRRLARRTRVQVTAEELEIEAAERLAVLTTGWLLVGPDGSLIDVPCNPANAAELYANNRMTWLREQVEAFLANRANFMMGSSKS